MARKKPLMGQCSNIVIGATIPETELIYTDQNGKFPVRSSKGFQYLTIMYIIDANAIIAEPLKSKNSKEM